MLRSPGDVGTGAASPQVRNEVKEPGTNFVLTLPLTADGFQGLTLSLNLVRRPEPHPSKHWDGWTPTLKGVLKKKRRDERRKR
jgi:hypothetical protein